MSITQRNRKVQVMTPLDTDTLLFYRMHGHDSLNEPFEYNLELISETNHSLDPAKILGKTTTIGMELQNGDWRYFNGIVSRFGQYGTVGNFALYRATLRPWLWLLTRTSNCRIFQKQSAVDIILKIFKDYGFSELQNKLSGSYRQRDYCVQYRETDFNFVSRLMEEEGISYHFSHEMEKHKLVLVDSILSYVPFPQYATIPFHPEPANADHYQKDYIHEWGISQEVQSGGYSLTDFDFTKPNASLLAKSLNPQKHSQNGFELFDYPGLYTELGIGEALTRIRLEEQHVNFEICEGQCNARGLVTGHVFDMTEHPHRTQNRRYLVLSSNFHLQLDEYTSNVSNTGGFNFSCSFNAKEISLPYRPHRKTPKPLIHGAQTAFVTGPAGEEIHTDKYGRVKIQFHWDRYSKGNQDSSCWVRVSQAWAGKNWGMVMLPRIGQEVIVEFLEGDPDQPIVTGRVYNDTNMPPYKLPDNANLSTFKTNSTKGGGGFNELRFDDKKGSEQIFIHGERNLDVRIKKDRFEWIGNESHLIVKKDRLEKIEGDDHTSVKGDSNTEVTGTISIKASQDMQEKVGMKHALDAGQEIHLKAGMNVVIDAGMSITLKAGGGFIVVGPAGVTISGTPVLINSGGSAGSGSGSSPDAPKPPKEAANDKPGKVESAPRAGRPPKPTTYSPSALVLQQAAKNGTPFCEKCAAAKSGASPSRAATS